MDSLYQTYMTGLLSAKVGLAYWEEENKKNPSENTLAQVTKLLAIVKDYEQKLEKLKEKIKGTKSIFDVFDWLEMLFSIARGIYKVWKN